MRTGNKPCTMSEPPPLSVKRTKTSAYPTKQRRRCCLGPDKIFRADRTKLFHVKQFGTIEAPGIKPQLVGFCAVARLSIFAFPRTFAPRPTLAYHPNNDSRKGRKEAPS